MERDTEILGLYRAQFERAKADQATLYVLQAGAVVASGTTALLDKPPLIYLSTLVALVLSFAAVYYSSRACQGKALAERARRTVLLTNGLGLSLSGKERADILGSFTVNDQQARKWEDEAYYQIDIPPSPARLAALLQESAFWSGRLFQQCAKKAWLYVVAISVVSLLVLLCGPLVPQREALLTISYLVCLVLNLLIANDQVGRALAYGQATTECATIDHRIETLNRGGLDQASILFVLGDYNATLEGTPMINSATYRGNHDRLKALWSKRLAGDVEKQESNNHG